ncbi:MAG: HPt (histidine-containing phosphotransfer) domain-containing protein [Arenicella sp.]|jgi:HPt (histidine-containing phosphotransfer) domain-containing protein
MQKGIDIDRIFPNSELSNDILQELLPSFIEDINLLFNSLEQGYADFKTEVVKKNCHAMKGVALTYGATEIVNAICALEDCEVVEENNTELKKKIRRLMESIQELDIFIK